MNSSTTNQSRLSLLMKQVIVVLATQVGTTVALAANISNHSDFDIHVYCLTEAGNISRITVAAMSSAGVSISSDQQLILEVSDEDVDWHRVIRAHRDDELIVTAELKVTNPTQSHVLNVMEVDVKAGIDPGNGTDISTHSAGIRPREVFFFATADPQYNFAPEGDCDTSGSPCDIGNRNADDTIERVRELLGMSYAGEGPNGFVIAGDLTQNTWANELCHYINKVNGNATYDDCDDDALGCIWCANASNCDEISNTETGGRLASLYVYDGLGNHDYEEGSCSTNGIMSSEIRSWVNRDRAEYIFRWRVQTSEPPYLKIVARPNYSWDWDDVYVIQLNLFPGNGAVECSSDYGICDLNQSLDYLRYDLECNVTMNSTCYPGYPDPVWPGGVAATPDYDRPIVLVQHYGPDSIDCDGGYADWTHEQANELWEAIKDYNVVAILFGHTERSPSQCSRFDLQQPFPGVNNRPDGRTSIPAFEVGSAKGRGSSLGAYTSIHLTGGNQMVIKRYDDQDAVTNPEYTWCINIDSNFYHDASTGYVLHSGTPRNPFGSLAFANTVMKQYDRNCGVAQSCTLKRRLDCGDNGNECCDEVEWESGGQLPVPTLHVAESRHTGPITLDTPMRIKKWNQ